MTNYTYAIGDIHGRLDLLEDLMGKIKSHWQAVNADNVTIVFLGDYVDRGPESAHVVAYLRSRVDEPNLKYFFLKGNHEDMMASASEFWIPNGGGATVSSYEALYPVAPIDALTKDAEWMWGLPTVYADDHRVFVHAYVDERKSIEDQDPIHNMWVRYDSFEDVGYNGKHVVHGHTPQAKGKPLMKTNRTNIDTGAVFKGGALTAAAFKDDQPGGPVAILQSWSE